MEPDFYFPNRLKAFFRFAFFLSCCFIGSLLPSTNLYAQLSGTYRLGTGGDYASFTEALSALETEGLSGPVTFKVMPGIYEEQLLINPIPGGACERPILFEGAGATQAEVVLQAGEGSDFTLKVNGADGIAFRHLSINGDMQAEGGTDCFQLEDNTLLGSVLARSSADERSNHHLYRNNYFRQGSIEKINEAPWDPGNPVFDEGLIIEGNKLSGGMVKIEGQQAFTISGNEIPIQSQEGVGLMVTNSWYGKEISDNSIGTSVGNYKGTNMVLNSAAASRITGNFAGASEGGFAMNITLGKSLENKVLIANNVIDVSGHDARGIYYFPISNLVGLDLSNPYPNQVQLYHNTIMIAGYSEYIPNYSLSLSGESNSFYLMNNIIMNLSNGTGLDVESPSAIAAMDHNNLYMHGADLFASWGSQEVASFSEWKSLTGFDEHSLSVGPGSIFQPLEDLQGAGVYQEEVPLDYFEQLRSNPPTIGAVEKAREGGMPLSGTFTIGGEDPDFATISAALAAMDSLGVQDSILFKLRPGTYIEQLKPSRLVGSPIITFEGESGDSTDVVISYPFGAAVLLDGTSRFRLREVTISTGIEQINSSGVLIENNVIEGGVEASLSRADTYRHNLFKGEGIVKRGRGHVEEGGNVRFETDLEVTIQGNQFEVDGSAIYLYGQADVLINNNYINIKNKDGKGATGISVNSSEEIKEIKHNIIVSHVPNTTAFNFTGGHFAAGLPQDLTHNKAELLMGGTGINYNFSGGSSPASLVANNLFSINQSSGENSSKGLETFFIPGEINFFHNSFYLYGEDPESKIIMMDTDIGENKVHIKNNILANQAGGMIFYGIFHEYPHKVAASDYNDLYTSGDTLAVWEENTILNLAEWQSLTGFDTHSLSVSPEFESAEKLIPENRELDGAGTSIAEVTVDYFGQHRETPPTIGAVELMEENQPPLANAGRDKTITLALDSLYLRGGGQDPDGVFRGFLWEKLSGPSLTMIQANTANVLLKDLVVGEYVFRFTVTDDDGASASDEMHLTILDDNQPPVANAGADKTVYLPIKSLQLSGTGKDPDGVFRKFLWEKVSGPDISMQQANTANLILSDLVVGEYVFRFTATDNDGASASDEMHLLVEPEPNEAPVVNAGADRTITLPKSSLQLSGTGHDPDGVFRFFLWEKVSGPDISMEQANTANLILSDFREGVYTFRFTARDDDGASASDEMILTVKASTALASQGTNTRLKAYPNTFQDHIYLSVEAEEPGEYHISVYDLVGKLYYRDHLTAGTFHEQPHKIDLSGFHMKEGIYLIRVENRNRNFQQVLKVVKGF